MTAPPPAQSRAALEADALLRRAVDRLPSMFAYWDREQRCRFANRAYERWFGVDPDSLPGTTLRTLLGPTLYALNRPHIEAALRGEAQTFERLVPGPDGLTRSALAEYLPDLGDDGSVQGFFVQVTELTPLRATQAALRESEETFRMLSEASPLGIYRATIDGACTYTNARWHEISGTGFEQSLGYGWNRTLHPDDHAAVMEGWQAASATQSPFEMEFRIQRPDGTVRRVRSTARAVLTAAGDAIAYVGALEDVTEQRSAEQQLRSTAAFLERAGRLAGVGGWELDLRSNTLAWSEHTRRIHEVESDHVPDVASAIAFYAPQARAAIEAAVSAGITHGRPWDIELPMVTARGRAIWVRTIGEVEYEAGRPVRLIGALQDITEQRQHRTDLKHEQALRLEIQRHAERSDRLLHERGEMLEMLAHEVRQPLNNAVAALQGATAALAEAGEQIASPRLAKAQAVLGEVLLGIDNTLAVASRLSRPEPIERLDVDIDLLLAVAIADMPAAERARISIDRQTGTRTASMDLGLVRLALRNVLDNALKFSPPGTPVSVRVSDWDDPLALVIEVADGGRGIAPDALETLFQRGAHVSHGRVPPSQGMGLGLHIAARVMALHGGRAELARNGADGVTMRLVLAQTEED